MEVAHQMIWIAKPSTMKRWSKSTVANGWPLIQIWMVNAHLIDLEWTEQEQAKLKYLLEKHTWQGAFENGGWKSVENRIFYVYIVLRYDPNSNTQLELKGWVCQNEALLYDKPGQKTPDLCPVQVITPPRQSQSGFWMDLKPNRTFFPVQTLTNGGLPGLVANARCDIYYYQMRVLVAMIVVQVFSSNTQECPHWESAMALWVNWTSWYRWPTRYYRLLHTIWSGWQRMGTCLSTMTDQLKLLGRFIKIQFSSHWTHISWLTNTNCQQDHLKGTLYCINITFLSMMLKWTIVPILELLEWDFIEVLDY